MSFPLMPTLHGFLATLPGFETGSAQLEFKQLRGGSEAAAVTLITARYRDDRGCSRLFRCVAKRLTGRPMREAAAYEALTTTYANGFAPRLLGIDRSELNFATIYVEAINQSCAWALAPVAAQPSVVTTPGAIPCRCR